MILILIVIVILIVIMIITVARQDRTGLDTTLCDCSPYRAELGADRGRVVGLHLHEAGYEGRHE